MRLGDNTKSTEPAVIALTGMTRPFTRFRILSESHASGSLDGFQPIRPVRSRMRKLDLHESATGAVSLHLRRRDASHED
jgi:hypothetical protein